MIALVGLFGVFVVGISALLTLARAPRRVLAVRPRIHLRPQGRLKRGRR